jgi:VanZ family protein
MKKIYWLFIIFLLALCFIWGNSVLSTQASSAISTAVGDFLATLFGSGDGATTVGGLSVRKMAHFVEFFVLGVIASLLFGRALKNLPMYALALALCALFVALIDETIQIFSGRGSSVRDIWIDIFGYTVGCLALAAIKLASDKLAERKRRKKNADIE